MSANLTLAREAIQTASERTDDATVHEQLMHIDSALDALRGDGAPADDRALGERLQELERQVVELGDDTDGVVTERLETARTHIDQFRREHAPDWESQ